MSPKEAVLPPSLQGCPGVGEKEACDPECGASPQERIWENPGKSTLTLRKGEFCPGQSWLDVGGSYPSKEVCKHKLNYSLLEKV